MEKFPETLSVKNKDKFDALNYKENMDLFRHNVYKHMISNNENDYFDLDKFSKSFCKNNTKSVERMLEIIVPELEQLGWKCQTSFGGTGLFIYSTESPPPSCHPDGF